MRLKAAVTNSAISNNSKFDPNYCHCCKGCEISSQDKRKEILVRNNNETSVFRTPPTMNGPDATSQRSQRDPFPPDDDASSPLHQNNNGSGGGGLSIGSGVGVATTLSTNQMNSSVQSLYGSGGSNISNGNSNIIMDSSSSRQQQQRRCNDDASVSGGDEDDDDDDDVMTNEVHRGALIGRSVTSGHASLLNNISSSHVSLLNNVTASHAPLLINNVVQQTSGGGTDVGRITPIGSTAPPSSLQLAALGAAAAAAHQSPLFNVAALSHHYGSISNVVQAAAAAASSSTTSVGTGFIRTPPSTNSLAVGGGASALRRYACKLCNEMFDSKAELQLHAQVHMREAKPYKCSHCPKNFANSSYLSQHMRIHLGIKPFGPCQYCQRKFTQLSHLQQHLRTHTGDKPYKCRFANCEKAFSQLSNLQSHSRCHQSDKPFKCNSCYKCFSDEQSLLEHIPKHKESKHLKVHICSFCGKSYTQATYLAKHMTKHSDRKSLKNSGICGTNGSLVTDDHHNASMWSPRDTSSVVNNVGNGGLCPVHGIMDSCSDLASPNAFPFNSFHQQLNPMMQSQNCAYSTGSIASTMAAAAGMGAADPSAFTRLAGLAPGALTGRFSAAATSRNPYSFAYENFKSSPHTAALSHHSTPYNQLIRLDDIRNYAGHQAAAAASAEHFGMLMKQQQQQQQQPRDPSY